MVLWKKLHHINLLPFYGAYMTDRFGMVSPWFENGDIVGFTRRNPEVNRLCLVRCRGCSHLGVLTKIPR